MTKTSPIEPWRFLAAAALGLVCAGAEPQGTGAGGTTLDETRLTMGKWIETQQIISKERNEWQQAKEILLGRVDLVKKEVAALEEKIRQAEAGAVQADRERQELLASKERLHATDHQLAESVLSMETRVRRLFEMLPEPVQTKLQPLFQRIPQDASNTKASVAERFQNVLGILNEINKANSDLAVTYEARTLADGKPSEVRVIYVGLAQAYYVSAGGEAGVGRPTEKGWTWTPSPEIRADVVTALDILQGKHTPAFVPLPMTIQ